MTAALEFVAPQGVDGDQDAVHLYCCNPDLAYCGIDISAEIDVGEPSADQACAASPQSGQGHGWARRQSAFDGVGTAEHVVVTETATGRIVHPPVVPIDEGKAAAARWLGFEPAELGLTEPRPRRRIRWPWRRV